MAVQKSTSGQLENAAREMIGRARFTEEHNAPCMELVEKFALEEGSDTLIVPKVGQMTMMGINEGEENTNEQDIGMTTISVTPSLVGAKVIVTDRLLRQNTQNIWGIVGKQMGDAMARKKDTDIIALFSALNGGTSLGAAAAPFSSANAVSCIGVARSNKYGSDLCFVMHPNQLLRLNRDLAVIGSGQIRPIPDGFSKDRLGKFFDGIVLSGIPFFHDGNITRDSSDDAIGAIFDKGALGILQSVAMRKEKERKPGIGDGAWALYVTADYGVFEIDDDKGAPCTYDAVDPATS